MTSNIGADELLCDSEILRYSRQISIKAMDFEGQEKLKLAVLTNVVALSLNMTWGRPCLLVNRLNAAFYKVLYVATSCFWIWLNAAFYCTNLFRVYS